MSMKRFLQRHPIAGYFGLAFGISWIGSFAAVGAKFFRGEPMQVTDGLLIFLPMLAGPSIAGLTMSRVVDGKNGLHDLFSRMMHWRVRARWYAAALLIPPVLILAVLLTLTVLVSPVFTPHFAVMGIAIGLLAGFFEEIGWMGYAFPKMQGGRSALIAAVSLGAFHGIWHLMAHYLGSVDNRGVYFWPNFFVMWIAAMTAIRVLIVWIYRATKSVLLAQLMHASSTGFLVILSPIPISPLNQIMWWTLYAVVLLIVVAIVVTVNGKDLVQHP